MVLDEIATKIATLVAVGTLITKGSLSATTDVCVTVYETGGQGADLGLGVNGIQFEYPTVQVVARGVPSDYYGPRVMVDQVYKGLPKVQAAALSGVYYHWIKPASAPFLLKRDEKDRVLIAVNFNIEKEP